MVKRRDDSALILQAKSNPESKTLRIKEKGSEFYGF
jgi:hypothetical protein